MNRLTREHVIHMTQRAVDKSESLGVNVCIAVMDPGAHLMSFLRMDNAFTGSVDVAIAKARTAVMFPLPTGQFGELIREEKLTGMEHSNQGLIGFPGGLPIQINNELVGAIGISGASADQDETIARYAIEEVNL